LGYGSFLNRIDEVQLVSPTVRPIVSGCVSAFNIRSATSARQRSPKFWSAPWGSGAPVDPALSVMVMSLETWGRLQGAGNS
jgi:hypothetical protein